MNAKKMSWLPSINTDEAVKYRVFCFPFAGAGSSIYRSWIEEMRPEIDVCPIQLPGRENRIQEPAIDNVEQMVAEVIEVIKSYLDTPFAFFGHCIGALIGYELASELKRQFQPAPEHIYVSAFRAPDYENPNRVLHGLTDMEIKEELRGYGGFPDAVLDNDDVMCTLMPMLRADFALHENYGFNGYQRLECPISVFGGDEDHIVRQEHMENWKDRSEAEVNMRIFKGGHFFLSANKEAILEEIRNNANELCLV